LTFKVGVTRDLLTASGGPCFAPSAFDVLAGNPDLEWEWVPEPLSEVTPEVAARYDGLHVNLPRVTRASVARADCRLRIVARNGVGFDSVDVAALTEKGIVLTNTPLSVRRPVAVATLTLLFALAGRLFEKDRLVRTGRWNDRAEFMGLGLTGRTLGLVGAGGIGQEILRVARPFFGRMIAADPYVEKATLAALGAELVPFDDVMRSADFVVVCCLLSPETRHLVDSRAFGLMKPTAYFLNVGRGPIHDEEALVRTLSSGRICGAALDVTEVEPIDPESPLLTMPNVIITPHALAWTDEAFADIASTALTSILDVSLGRAPRHMVNSDVWQRRRG
jgi:phosphoglycerate dehydrogenase-like enzyme